MELPGYTFSIGHFIHQLREVVHLYDPPPVLHLEEGSLPLKELGDDVLLELVVDNFRHAHILGEEELDTHFLNGVLGDGGIWSHLPDDLRRCVPVRLLSTGEEPNDET